MKKEEKEAVLKKERIEKKEKERKQWESSGMMTNQWVCLNGMILNSKCASE